MTVDIQIMIQRCRTDCPVKVGNSKRHGKGVFAMRDIAMGEAVAYYDGYNLVNPPSLTLEQHQYSMQYLPEWETNANDHTTRIGFKSPISNHGCAQFFNDAIRPDLDSLVHSNGQIRWKDCLEESQKYLRKGVPVSMVQLDTNKEAINWFFACRDIRKGEEIVYHYGENYWYHSNWYSHNSPKSNFHRLRQIVGTTTHASVMLAILFVLERPFLQQTYCSDEETEIVLKRYRLCESFNQIWDKDKDWSIAKEPSQVKEKATKRFLLMMLFTGLVIQD
ncbi:MAG: SET domain-containing protein-lysine N-methyltransferase [Sphingobacteriaceae bacterium]|nr:MAG: SET domain-containing protein-lysine N-methyltransferase [Sphingobacteriaceae bacterium]